MSSKKKLAVIGAGTAGCYALSHFMKWTDWDIVLYHDTHTKPQKVGEGSDVTLPQDLYQHFGFTYDDLPAIEGSLKLGIRKINWHGTNDFKHALSAPNLAMHFNASKLQKFIIDQYKDNKRLTIIDQNINHSDIDADFIMDCSGRPKDYDEYNLLDSIPVNSVYVTQCYWDKIDFLSFEPYTLTIARPHGWVFGVPLTSRCAIGYMYNNNISTLDEVKEDVSVIFKDYNLTPSTTTNNFSFKTYYRKQNFDSRVAYNGNASFFLEPLEATAITAMAVIQRTAFDIWNGKHSVEFGNHLYHKRMTQIENIIMSHYYAGSIFDTNFWKYANERGTTKMKDAISDPAFMHIINVSKKYSKPNSFVDKFDDSIPHYGTWSPSNFADNFENFDLYKKFDELLKNV